jgi:Protein of unknown function (DUF2971)
MKSKPNSNKIELLRHYVGLSGLLHILTEKKIVLGEPSSWVDMNDRHVMKEYGAQKGYETVRAVCFAMGKETYHHWQTYSNDKEGACIEFKGAAIKKSLKEKKGFIIKPVQYKWVNGGEGLRSSKDLNIDDVPFLKRKAFEAEAECRVVFVSKTKVDENPVIIKIDTSWIVRVLLSPQMHSGKIDAVIAVINKIDGASGIKVEKSKVVENKTWMKAVSMIARKSPNA